MKRAAQILLSLILLLGSVTSVSAIVNPMDVPNNRFGIHLMDENDLTDAAALVNSNGGDWGYVTIVIREDERDTARWNRAFAKMNKLHLIPLVRVATAMTNEGWTQGSLDEIKLWTIFFGSLDWPTENRYVIVGNEPNHAKEWHGEISPEEYADYLAAFSKHLKSDDDRYFILPAGFDASAPTDSDHLDEETFLRRMHAHNPKIFEFIDGWNSHSYPNPGFMGLPTDSGRKSIKTYEWELELLSKLGVEKSFPIFITETGWVHNTVETSRYLDETTVSENFVSAFTEAWDDERIVAVTPFMLTFPGEPFLQFAWRDHEGKFLEFYFAVQELPKTKGEPVIKSVKIDHRPVPIKVMPAENDLLVHIDRYRKIVLVNTTSVWVS